MTGLAGFDFQALNQKYLAQPANDAANYGVSIMRTKAANCWRCIGAYHLTPSQNRGRHNVFIECLDENGNRVKDAVISWTESMDRPTQTKRPDKPDNEPATDIPLNAQDTVTVTVSDGIARDSDSVGNLHFRHTHLGDWGHHSYYLVWQRQSGIVTEPPPVEPPPLTLESVAQQTAAHEQRLAALERIVGDWTGGK